MTERRRAWWERGPQGFVISMVVVGACCVAACFGLAVVMWLVESIAGALLP